MNEKVEKAFNKQLALELESAYAYLAMSAYAEDQSLPGIAHWLRTQYAEELEHAMRFYGFITDRNGRVRLEAIDKPPEEFKSPLDVFETSLAQEKAVTAAINDLYTLALEQRDYASQVFLNWFVTEQVEEEKIITEVVDALRRVGDRGEALFLVDKDLGERSGTT